MSSKADISGPPQRRVFLELSGRSCRWPVVDPRSSDFFFCGAEAFPGKPYCVAHCTRAYRPAEDATQRTMRDSPLERAFARNVITQEQYSAGQKYRHYWYHAGLTDSLESVDLNRIFAQDLGGFSGMAKSESQVFRWQRYREATQSAGKIGSHVRDWAVCREVVLEQVGYTLGWSSRAQAYAAAVERMKAALDELCKLWGIRS
jgi:GcrA cell cycle regulator